MSLHPKTPALALLVSFAVAAADLAAQTVWTWSQHTAATRPFARSSHAMAYDAARAQTVLFGGHNGAVMNDTWVYDGAGWRQLQPANVPPARADHAMAYDPVRQRIVVLGGTGLAGPLADVWEWDGTDWLQRAASVPGVAAGGAACHDPIQGGVFYNRSATNLLWNGVSAQTVTVANPQGDAPAMVFDAASAGVLTNRGGRTAVFRVGSGWQEIATTNSQYFGLNRYALAIDPFAQRIVLQGGNGFFANGSGQGLLQTFVYRGGTWNLVLPELPATGRDSHAMVFDLARRAFVMFGGRRNQGGITDDTWELRAQDWLASWSPGGSSCSGASTFAPALAPETMFNAVPTLGGSWFVRLDGLPPGALTFGIVGFSDQRHGGLPLPIDLSPFGMPGCALAVAGDVVEALGASNAAGWLWWRVAVPAQPVFLGTRFFQQAAVVHAPANAAGVLWTNAGRGTIGVR